MTDVELVEELNRTASAWSTTCPEQRLHAAPALVNIVVPRCDLSTTSVDDRQFENLTIDELLDIAGPDRPYIFLADRQTMTDPKHALLVVDTDSAEYDLRTPRQNVRVTQPGIQSIESSLSIANMDFVNFVESADSNGVFRGFEPAANPPQHEHLSIGTFREAVKRHLDRPLFPELNTDNHGNIILVDVQIDIQGYGSNVRKPRTNGGWREEGRKSSCTYSTHCLLLLPSPAGQRTIRLERPARPGHVRTARSIPESQSYSPAMTVDGRGPFDPRPPSILIRR